MSLLIGKLAPQFEATAVFKSEFKNIKLSDYLGKYVILFFYPLNFTFVCPTELHAFQERLSCFNSLNAEVFGCSVDSHFSHFSWLSMPKSEGGINGIEYGLIADVGGNIAKNYGVLGENNIAYRGLFLIDKCGIVRHQMVNDLSIGRSVDEVLRTLEALIHVESYGEVCPANWNKNKTAVNPNIESIKEYLKNI